MSQNTDQKDAKEAEKVSKAAEKAANQAGSAAITASTDGNAVETQKVSFLRRCPGYAYWPGDTANLAVEDVALLVEGKFAVLVAEGENEVKTAE